MTKFNPNMTLAEIAKTSAYQTKIAKFMLYNEKAIPGYEKMTPANTTSNNGQRFFKALTSLEEAHNAGCDRDFEVYSKEEVAKNPDKKDVHLFFFPGKKDSPFVLLVPGGAYINVWNWTEGFESAVDIAEKGLNVFVLTYRVDVPGLLPKPIEDIAAALDFIFDGNFEIDKKHYAVGGFSAGGHAVSIFGSDNHGFAKYGLPSPVCLFLLYPVISTDILYDEYKAAGENYQSNLSYIMLERIGGKDFTRESLHEFSAIHHCQNYPPAFIVHGKADTLVNPQGSVDLANELEKEGLKHKLILVPGAGHGFSTGDGSPAYGWIDGALEFMKECME